MTHDSTPMDDAIEVGRNVRKLFFMSRGMALAVVGIWLVCVGVMQWAIDAFQLQPYKLLFAIPMIPALVLPISWLERVRAKKDCSVQPYRRDSVKEEIALFAVISLGVAIVVVCAEMLEGRIDTSWISRAFFGLFMAAGGFYFVYEGARHSLFELVIIGALFWLACAAALYFDFDSVSEAQFNSGVPLVLIPCGMVFSILGTMLQRRWSAWRAEVLQR